MSNNAEGGGMYGHTRPGNPPMTKENYALLSRKLVPQCAICGQSETRYPYQLANFQVDDQALPVCATCKPDLKELMWKLVQGKRATLGLGPMSTQKRDASR
jgi:hypothetical protein